MPDSDLLQLRTDEVSWTQSDDGEVVILDHRTSKYLAIGPSGAPLWDALREGATEPALVAALVEAYDLDADRAAHDVALFLDDLRAVELL